MLSTDSIKSYTLLSPEYMLLLEFAPTPQTEMRDRECEQPHVPCGAEEMVQDAKSDPVWDLNQPKGDVVYELFERFLIFWSYYKTQVQIQSVHFT
jgi:hypothetical protein